MDFSLLQNPDVIAALKEGFIFTLTVTVLAMMGGILIGTPLAMMRLSSNAIASNFAKFYVDLFRGIPLIQVIFIFYFLLPKIFEFQSDTYWGPLFSSVVTFAIFEAAFFRKLYVLEFSLFQKVRYMQATRLVLPMVNQCATWFYLKPFATCFRYC